MGDAIVRTLIRLLVTRRHLLEWVTAAQAKTGPRLDLMGFYRQMAGAVVIAALAMIIALAAGRATWPLALPFAALWLASPAIARWTSRSPPVAGRLPMSDGEASILRLTARRTWRFFETFVTAADHMLPPDNFQEDPAPVLAHRTSPTNIGLYLLATVSARDFGWSGTIAAVGRLEATLSTMRELESFRGHLFNWYDTRDLRPLDPRYISSVDSGNLAGHLIALANACREWRDHPIASARRLAGIADAIALTREEASRLRDQRRMQTVTWRQLDDALAGLAAEAAREPDEDMAPRLAALAAGAETVADIARAFAIERGDDVGADMLFWAEAARARHREPPRRPRRLACRRDRAGRTARRAGRSRARERARHGVRLSARPRPQAALDRLPGGG